MAKRIGDQAEAVKAPLRKAKSAGTRTLGPVSDLERLLPTDWWRPLFNSLYLETDGDVVENDRNTDQEIELLVRSAALNPNDRILDLCCGQGRHALENSSIGIGRDAVVGTRAQAINELRYSELLRLILEAAQERAVAARPRLAEVAPERVAVG